MRRILANVCTDLRYKEAAQERALERVSSLDAGSGVLPDHAEGRASDGAVRAAIVTALAPLPDTQAQAFWLRDVEERPYAEVAWMTGVSEENARAHTAPASRCAGT